MSRNLAFSVTFFLTAILAGLACLNLFGWAVHTLFYAMFVGPEPQRIAVGSRYGVQPAFLVELAAIPVVWLAYALRWQFVAIAIVLLPISNQIAVWCSRPPSSGWTYEKVDGVWFCMNYNDRGRRSHQFDADNETFHPVTQGDRACYGRDKNRAYWYVHVIPGADAESFVALGGDYSRDKAKVYCGTLAMHVADPAAFEVVRPRQSKHEVVTKESLIGHYGDEFKEVEVSHKSPALVGSGWGRDGVSYFFGPSRVQGADYATFEILDDIVGDKAKDKNGVYSGWKKEEAEK